MSEQSVLWTKALSDRDADVHTTARTRLRSQLTTMREYAGALAGEIVRDAPDFTVHDITHLDSLWEMADIIAGEDYPLTPTEAFIFGGAVLVHDLAMGSAAYPSGSPELVGKERWRDTLLVHLRRYLGHDPAPEDFESPPESVSLSAKQELLRELHAEEAGRLPHRTFNDPSGGPDYYLITDPDLRNLYGDLIGRIAASHWWNASRLASEFNVRIGAPSTLPREWTVDPLKLACLLRVADASHIDSRRAPGFLRAIRNPGEGSRVHWIFQEKMQRPWLDIDRLVYTSSQPFRIDEAEAWWLCYDTLQMIDSELRTVDALLGDSSRPRLLARSVAYVDSPDRLAMLVPARDWFPVDARIKVGDVVGLVKKLGGSELYGNKPEVAVRELISNAADAIRARRLLQQTNRNFDLEVRVEIQEDNEGATLIVQDDGIGMPKHVLAGALLDFGRSYR